MGGNNMSQLHDDEDESKRFVDAIGVVIESQDDDHTHRLRVHESNNNVVYSHNGNGIKCRITLFIPTSGSDP